MYSLPLIIIYIFQYVRAVAFISVRVQSYFEEEINDVNKCIIEEHDSGIGTFCLGIEKLK